MKEEEETFPREEIGLDQMYFSQTLKFGSLLTSLVLVSADDRSRQKRVGSLPGRGEKRGLQKHRGLSRSHLHLNAFEI